MLSEETLVRNLAALDEAQGQRPAFASLDPRTTRAVEHEGTLRIEVRAREGSGAAHDWIPLWGAHPDAEAAEQLSAAGDAAHLLVIGGGVGHLLDAIERAGKSTKVIVLEPDPGMAVLFLARRDWTSWFSTGRLRMLTGPDYVGASSCARLVNGAQPMAVVVNPVMAAHRPEAVEHATVIAQRIQQDARANADARKRFAGRYVLQTLGNLPVIQAESDVAALDAAFAGRPAVIAAAGPSLDAILPVLAAYQDQVVVVGCDTTLRPLLAGGVRPHLLVGIDPGEVNARHLSGVADTDGIWLAAEGSLHPSAYPAFTGRTFILKISDHEPWPWLRELGLDRGLVRAWGSVATSAFDLTLRMGCDPVIFVGHDLAFTNDRPYCDNTVFHDDWRACLADKPLSNIRHYEELMMGAHPIVRATDINGEPLNTHGRLIAFRDWIVEQTTITHDRRFINATGGGILHGPRIEQMSLELALGTHAGSRFDVRATLAAAYRRGRIPTPSDAVIARWIEFTAGTVTAEQLRAALQPPPA
jgi:hypothetical protein